MLWEYSPRINNIVIDPVYPLIHRYRWKRGSVPQFEALFSSRLPSPHPPVGLLFMASRDSDPFMLYSLYSPSSLCTSLFRDHITFQMPAAVKNPYFLWCPQIIFHLSSKRNKEKQSVLFATYIVRRSYHGAFRDFTCRLLSHFLFFLMFSVNTNLLQKMVNMEYATLNNGAKLPLLGLGTWQVRYLMTTTSRNQRWKMKMNLRSRCELHWITVIDLLVCFVGDINLVLNIRHGVPLPEWIVYWKRPSRVHF